MITNETYTIRFLTPELLYIKWHQTPLNGSLEGLQFIQDLTDIFAESQTILYILSDLRNGRLTDVVQIRQLSKLTKHRNYGGSVAFGDDYQTSVYAGLFATVANREDEIQPTLDRALAHLEDLAPGLTASINIPELEILLG